MEEVVGLLQEILSELQTINGRLNDLTGYGVYGISDVCSSVDDAITEICNKIDDIELG